MESKDEHTKKLKEIADYAFSNGKKIIGLKQLKKPINTWSEKLIDNFIIACNDGFKIAQEMLIQEIQTYQKLLIESKTEIKKNRKLNKPDKIRELNWKIKIIEQRILNFTHIADGIAWQILGENIHIAKRLNIRDTSSKILENSNIKHALSTANMINENPHNFALISDITGYIQIGDLLIKNKGKTEIIELKEGKVNEQINKFFEQARIKNIEITDEVLTKTFDSKTTSQAKRMMRQNKRMEEATHIINNDTGIDPFSKMKMDIVTPQIPTTHYYSELIKLKNELKNKIWSNTIIDDCLHVGMYRDEGLLMAPFAIKSTLKTKNHIIIDWMTIKEQISEPIFSKPLSPEFIIDILTGQIKIIIGIDLDEFVELANKYNLDARWLTTKETSKMKEDDKTKSIICCKNKCIGAKLTEEIEIVLSTGGIISKILYDNIKPSNIFETITSSKENLLKIINTSS